MQADSSRWSKPLVVLLFAFLIGSAPRIVTPEVQTTLGACSGDLVAHTNKTSLALGLVGLAVIVVWIAMYSYRKSREMPAVPVWHTALGLFLMLHLFKPSNSGGLPGLSLIIAAVPVVIACFLAFWLVSMAAARREGKEIDWETVLMSCIATVAMLAPFGIASAQISQISFSC